MPCCEEDQEPGSFTGKYVVDVQKDDCNLIVLYSDNTSTSYALDCADGSEGDEKEVPEPLGTSRCAVAQTLTEQIVGQWEELVGDIGSLLDASTVAAVVAGFVQTHEWPIGAIPGLMAWALAGWTSGLHFSAQGTYNLDSSAYQGAIKAAIYCCLPENLQFTATERMCARNAFYDSLDTFYQSFQTFWLMFPLVLSKEIALYASLFDPGDYTCDDCGVGSTCDSRARSWDVGSPYTIDDGFAFVQEGMANFTPDWWVGWWAAPPNALDFSSAVNNGKPATTNCMTPPCKSLGLIYILDAPCTIEILDSRSRHPNNNTVGRAWFVLQNGVWTKIKHETRSINGPPIPQEFKYQAGVDGPPLHDVERVCLVCSHGGSTWFVDSYGVNTDL